MANGKVITGYSKPYVALYNPGTNNSPYYSGGIPLARGVSVSISLESGESNTFYADNTAQESAGGLFTGGTLTLVVDGLKDPARRLIAGIKTTGSVAVGSETVTTMEYDDTQAIPYVGVGFIVRYMENGNTTYAPRVLKKTMFSPEGLEAATQEESIEFQTSELEATIMQDDSPSHAWMSIAADQTTEAEAEAVLKAMLSVE